MRQPGLAGIEPDQDIFCAARHLAPHEIALLALLEVVLGPLWVWLGVGEAPTSSTLQGGALVLAALVLNELVGRRAPR